MAMRLGVVGMVPGDPRAVTGEQLQRVASLGVSAACFHVPGAVLAELNGADLRACRQRYRDAGLGLAQMGVGYGECLFDPDPAVRAAIQASVARGLQVAGELAAGVALIRTGSLSRTGSYSPSPRNHEPGRLQTLIGELRTVAAAAESAGITVVVETHNLTILGTPEINRRVIDAVGSPRLGVVMDFVNHFQSLQQAYASTTRIDHIFDVMGPIAPIGHIKDLATADGFVVHLNEALPGEGCLDLHTAVRRWEALAPDRYLLVEHLPDERIPAAVANVQRIAAEAGVAIH
ncbi:MAG: TIM barrel protein [Spirochaetaceae bacterium]|nr:TIM barrel protein [Spirochaetaceae bacterium]